MPVFKFLRIIVVIALLSTGIKAQTNDIPKTNAGKLLKSFLEVIETGKVEEFVNSVLAESMVKEISKERYIRFLRMLHRMYTGFKVYKIVNSEKNNIEVICKSNDQNAWRIIIIKTDDNHSDKITGINMRQTAPTEEYLSILPKVEIERPEKDNSIVNGNLGEKIDEYMKKIESVGYSGALIVGKQNEIILAKGYGYIDRENKKIFDRNTVFTIGSITKQFTGAAIVKLESAKKLSFDDPITKFFDSVPKDKKAITLHHLLTHTAGFPGAIGDDFEKISRDDFVKRAMKTKLKFKPGEKYSYSNVGYSLLGAIIEIVTGQSYEKFLREKLFLPAGMKHTGYILPDWNEEDIVIGYKGEEKWGKPTELMWTEDGPGWHLKCNGGILSTINDMYKWGKAILGDNVFTEEEKKKYLTPYVAEGPDAESYYAYGWVRMKSRKGNDVITHNGGNPYIQNDMYIYPDDGIIMYITSNNGNFSAIHQSSKILDMIFNSE